METSDESERSSHSSPSSSVASTENGESGGAPAGNKKALWSACGYGDLTIVKQYMIGGCCAGRPLTHALTHSLTHGVADGGA